MAISKEYLQDILLKSTSLETSSDKDHWSKENPLLGHCAVVELIVQDLYGGEILRASLMGTEFEYMRSHYWNLLPDGEEKDFTATQFGGSRPKLKGEIKTREYILSHPDTVLRYEKLRDSISELI